MNGVPLVDVDAAQVSRGPDGAVTFDDPGSPLLLTVHVTAGAGRPHITRLQLQARHPQARISSAALARLPLSQVLLLAAAQQRPQWPNEAHYRALATPKPRGQRHWDPGHWERVLAVYEWARQSGRPGGAAQAVADLWCVAVDPTAYRWLAEARRRLRPREQ